MMLQCKSDAISGKTLDSEQARFLMDIKDEYLSLLASSADEITREINTLSSLISKKTCAVRIARFVDLHFTIQNLPASS